jgi:hypothetical protein
MVLLQNEACDQKQLLHQRLNFYRHKEIEISVFYLLSLLIYGGTFQVIVPGKPVFIRAIANLWIVGTQKMIMELIRPAETMPLVV